MADQSKSLWLIVLLVTAGIIILVLSWRQDKSQQEQGIVLQEIFNQQVPLASLDKVEALSKENLKDPIPMMAIVTSPENGQEAGFTIQVYSFQDKGRAFAAETSLKSSGYNAFMIMSDLGDKGTWYRIRVGGIPNEAAASKLLSEIRKNFNSGFIVNPNK